MNRSLVLSHRGYHVEHPENTLDAFRAAIDLQVDGIETDIRLTADGVLRMCLLREKEIDLLTPLRNGEDVVSLIRQSVHEKAEKLGGQFNNFHILKGTSLKNRSMISIGG